MKKFLCFISVLLMYSLCNAQITVDEPDFINQSCIVKNNNLRIPTENCDASVDTGVDWKSGKKDASFLTVDGASSNCRIEGGEVKIIVRCENNDYDPTTIITIYQLESKKKKRKTLLKAYKTNKKNTISFTGEKYGKQSYILTANIKKGEYCIILSSVKNNKVSCFGVD